MNFLDFSCLLSSADEFDLLELAEKTTINKYVSVEGSRFRGRGFEYHHHILDGCHVFTPCMTCLALSRLQKLKVRRKIKKQ